MALCFSMFLWSFAAPLLPQACFVCLWQFSVKIPASFAQLDVISSSFSVLHFNWSGEERPHLCTCLAAVAWQAVGCQVLKIPWENFLLLFFGEVSEVSFTHISTQYSHHQERRPRFDLRTTKLEDVSLYQRLFPVPEKGGIGSFHKTPPEGNTDPTFYGNQKQPLIFSRILQPQLECWANIR